MVKQNKINNTGWEIMFSPKNTGCLSMLFTFEKTKIASFQIRESAFVFNLDQKIMSTAMETVV